MTPSAHTCGGWGLVVVAVMLVLLFVAFRSVVLPLKAVVMNAVSMGASLGVVTWIFQDGHLSGLLGFTSPGYLDVTQPILMLGIIFGLFATSGIVFIKMIGVGMLVAVLVDATVVRALLVPATMRLLGTASWWAPGPMRRWWERHLTQENQTASAGPR